MNERSPNENDVFDITNDIKRIKDQAERLGRLASNMSFYQERLQMMTTQREQGKGPFTEVTIGANIRLSLSNTGMGEAAKKVQARMEDAIIEYLHDCIRLNYEAIRKLKEDM